jgi:hypothetical protein
MTSELEEHLAALDDEIEAPEHFQIENDGAAAWAMRKLRRLRQHQESNNRLAAEQIEKIEDWLIHANRPSQDSIRFFESILSNYAVRQRIEEDRKTIDLPEGKISTRSGSLKWAINGEVFLPWARENAPDLIRIKEEAALSEVKARLEVGGEGIVFDPSTGEHVPGVSAQQQDISVSIAPDLEV